MKENNAKNINKTIMCENTEEFNYLQEQKYLYALLIELRREVSVLQLTSITFIKSTPAKPPVLSSLSNLEDLWYDVNNCGGNICYNLIRTVAYDKLSHLDSIPSQYAKDIQFGKRVYYLKNAIFSLYSFREKIAYITYSLFDQKVDLTLSRGDYESGDEIKILKEISYQKLADGVKHFKEHLSWFSEDEINQVQKIWKAYASQNVNELLSFRNACIHRPEPGVDSCSFGMLCCKAREYPSQREIGKTYLGTGSKSWAYRDLLDLTLKVWDDFIKNTQKLDVLSSLALAKERIKFSQIKQ